jgi:hypothetical protein
LFRWLTEKQESRVGKYCFNTSAGVNENGAHPIGLIEASINVNANVLSDIILLAFFLFNPVFTRVYRVFYLDNLFRILYNLT